MPHAPDDILTLSELAAELRLDRRTIVRVASLIGGRQFGNRWRFRWGAVMEAFNDADTSQRQRQRLVGQGGDQWQADCLPDVSARQERRSGMEGRKGMGGGKNTGSKTGDGSAADPYGLRAALGLG